MFTPAGTASIRDRSTTGETAAMTLRRPPKRWRRRSRPFSHGSPCSPARNSCACRARAQWTGEVEALGDDTATEPLVIDALFGTGLKRGLDQAAAKQLSRLSDSAIATVACDLPSGVETNTGAEFSQVPKADLCVTFG